MFRRFFKWKLPLSYSSLTWCLEQLTESADSHLRQKMRGWKSWKNKNRLYFRGEYIWPIVGCLPLIILFLLREAFDNQDTTGLLDPKTILKWLHSWIKKNIMILFDFLDQKGLLHQLCKLGSFLLQRISVSFILNY